MLRGPYVVLLILALSWTGPLTATLGDEDGSQAQKSAARQPRSTEASDSLRPSEKDTHAVAARRIAAKQLIAAAVKELQDISDMKTKSLAWNLIAKAQVKAGDVVGAKATVANLKGSRDDFYSMIAESQAESGDLAGARATAELIKGQYDKAGVNRAFVSAQLKAGDQVGAIATAAQIIFKDTQGSDERAGLRARAYAEIAEAQFKAGDRAGAIKSLKDAAAAAAQDPSVNLCLEIAAAQVKAGDKAAACKTVRIAREAARQMQGSKSMPVAYRQVFEAQVMAGDLAGAKEGAAKMTGRLDHRELEPMAYLGIVAGQAKTGDVAGAKATALAINDPIKRGSAYSEIAYIQAKAGDYKGAMATTTLIDSDPIKDWAYCAIARTQAEGGDNAGARTTAAKIKEEFPKREACCAIAKAQAKAGKFEEAHRSFDAGGTLAATIKEDRDRDFAYCRLVEDRMEAGDWAGAKATAAQLGRAVDQASIYQHIAEGQAKAGRLAEARDTMDVAVQAATHLRGEEQVMAYSRLAQAQAKLGNVNEAKRLAANDGHEGRPREILPGARLCRDHCRAGQSRGRGRSDRVLPAG